MELEMNDFTKGELYEILALLGIECEKFDVYNKIQSMIDNYCEHIWSEGSGNLLFCFKCQAYVGKR
jgi:UDP-N-acetylglucosamine transferase subunit ALG13